MNSEPNHEKWHRYLALRVYDELESDEERELERHLEACSACAAFGRELQTTLGPLVARDFHELLRQAGVSDDDLELMSVINPNRVLFEDALAATGRAAAE